MCVWFVYEREQNNVKVIAVAKKTQINQLKSTHLAQRQLKRGHGLRLHVDDPIRSRQPLRQRRYHRIFAWFAGGGQELQHTRRIKH